MGDVEDLHARCWFLVACCWLLGSGCLLIVARYWLALEIKKPEERNWILDSRCRVLVAGSFIVKNALLRTILNSRPFSIFVLGPEVILHYHLQISISLLA
jgi:hypothetical protein